MYTLQNIAEVSHLEVPPRWTRYPVTSVIEQEGQHFMDHQTWWHYVLTAPNRGEVNGWFQGSYNESVNYLEDTLNVQVPLLYSDVMWATT